MESESPRAQVSPARPRARVLWISLVIVLVVAGGGAAVAYHYLSSDSGVRACKKIAAHMTAMDNGRPWPLDPHARADFAGSRLADIRVAGTTMVDFLNDAARSGYEAPNFDDTLVTDYTNVSRACGNHGVTMPPLGFPGD